MLRSIILALAILAWPLAVPAGAQEREEDVHDVVRRAAALKKAPVVFDEALRGKKVVLPADLPNDYETIRIALQVFAIELVEDEVAGKPIIKAYLQRTLPTVVFEHAPIFDEDDPLPEANRVITVVYRVRHCDANQIHAAIRGIMTRDPRRCGNIIYFQGSETLLITDFTSTVRSYLAVARALDRPPERPSPPPTPKGEPRPPAEKPGRDEKRDDRRDGKRAEREGARADAIPRAFDVYVPEAFLSKHREFEALVELGSTAEGWPVAKDGRKAYMFGRIDERSPLKTVLGLQEGDIILSVNGHPVTGENGRELHERLRGEKRFEVLIDRQGLLILVPYVVR